MKSMANKFDLTYTCRTLNPKTAEHTSFSSTLGTFKKLTKYQCMFSDHNRIKLELTKKITKNCSHICKLGSI